MAPNPRSSFIPKETSGVIPMQIKKRRSVHVFSMLSSVIFLASLVAAIGMFFYGGMLEKRLEESKVALSQVDEIENDRKIEEIRIYNEKLMIAEDLLDNHIAPSRIFEEIENSTKVTVQFDTLEYIYDPGFEAELTLAGNTAEFTGVALQKMQLLEDSLFSDFLVKDISTSQDSDAATGASSAQRPDGTVGFTVNGLFRKDVVEYTGEGRSSAEATVNISAEPEEGEASLEGDMIDGTQPSTMTPPVNVNEGVIPPQL